MSFFVAILLDPEIQTKAQAEIDVVTGRERLPTFDDRPRLPYVDAVCRELLRWRPPIPLGEFCTIDGSRTQIDRTIHSRTPCSHRRQRVRGVFHT